MNKIEITYTVAYGKKGQVAIYKYFKKIEHAHAFALDAVYMNGFDYADVTYTIHGEVAQYGQHVES